jgi:hypothetical protein
MMWLLDTSNLGLEEFSGDEIPPYAIISHTWGLGEISLHDISENFHSANTKVGFKVQKCCEQAIHNKPEYVWIDIYCI